VFKSPNDFVETRLNSEYPIIAAEPEDDMEIIILLRNCIGWPYVYEKDLPSDAECNPDKYIQ